MQLRHILLPQRQKKASRDSKYDRGKLAESKDPQYYKYAAQRSAADNICCLLYDARLGQGRANDVRRHAC